MFLLDWNKKRPACRSGGKYANKQTESKGWRKEGGGKTRFDSGNDRISSGLAEALSQGCDHTVPEGKEGRVVLKMFRILHSQDQSWEEVSRSPFPGRQVTVQMDGWGAGESKSADRVQKQAEETGSRYSKTDGR